VAAIDVSDGLAIDLRRLAARSGAGAVIEAEKIPWASGFPSLAAALDADPLTLALGGGEDYVLLFTLPARQAPPAAFQCHAIGQIVAGDGLDWIHGNVREPLPALGWDHLAGSPGEIDEK
jgi:thiamine-monophosphate kinase